MEEIKQQFIQQEYQQEAVDSIVDLFEGAQVKESIFTIVSAKSGKLLIDEFGYANKMMLPENKILENLNKVQERNNIEKDKDISSCGMNFSVEMETGTGKTYVYTKTIFELNKKYGWKKFIIVVPSVAIKEGVNGAIKDTKEHFSLLYNNVPFDFYVYSDLSKIKDFAQSTNIQIMIMTIAAFNKEFNGEDKDSKGNINKIYRSAEELDGWKGIDLIKSTNPIVIIDEPQSVVNTTKAKNAINNLNPLFVLRYSATHKEIMHLTYRLTPVDAFQKHLVKGITVCSIEADQQSAKPYIKVLGITGEGGGTNRARLEICQKQKDGSIAKAIVKVKAGEDLWDVSKQVEYYGDNGYIVEDIDAFKDDESILFKNGTVLRIGEVLGGVNEDALKRAQIRKTIYEHLKKERRYVGQNIKVLSLFFIDKVSNYHGEGEKEGKYAKWFEEEFNNLMNTTYKSLKDKYPQMCYDAKIVHDGYFSQDKKRYIDTKGDGEKDDTTYNLIMKNKGKLLSLKTPTRFIFSHSALKEGWDNPNVFQVCTLVETQDTLTKRQKIGRGLRLCVDQEGKRVESETINNLSVIANESYKDFCSALQTEFKELGYKFGIVESIAFVGIKYVDNGKEHELSQDDSKEIFEILTQKGYVNKKDNKITPKFHEAVANGSFDLGEKFTNVTDKVEDLIKNSTVEKYIKNEKEKVKINKNKKVIDSPVFIDIWNRIKQKTIYSINIDIDAMKDKAVEYIKTMPKMKKESIYSKDVSIDITKAGVKYNDESTVQKKISSYEEYEQIQYPDFIRRITDATQLLRGTIIKILYEANCMEEFRNNPEEFIKEVSKLINKAKTEKMANGIQYSKIDEFYKQEEIFDDTELYGIKGSNVIDITNSSKNPLDHVLFDSKVEENYARACEKDPDVILYAKLPAAFKIDTPFGKYNPDWMLVLKTDNDDFKMYFVAETKGGTSSDDLRPNEWNKILCGKKHFEVLDKDLKYKMVKTLKELKEGEYN